MKLLRRKLMKNEKNKNEREEQKLSFNELDEYKTEEVVLQKGDRSSATNAHGCLPYSLVAKNSIAHCFSTICVWAHLPLIIH